MRKREMVKINNEKLFNEVIASIKYNEVWKTDNTEIYLNNEGALLIKHKNYLRNFDINVLGTEVIAINLKSKYRLKLNKE